ncbi:MAG: CPBP family intramembrane metalloprotease [Planctomycetes bacterium]|nr:CPBP family intramembrane metalloprotease [Planctomycetota bacterium]
MARPRLRTACGLIIAAVAVTLVLPEWLTPVAQWLGNLSGGALDPTGWLQWARGMISAATLGATWPLLPALVSVGLLLACWCIPAAPEPLRRPRSVIRDETAMAVGALLLAEPLMHLGFLAWSGWHPSVVSRDAVLPVPFQAVAAGAQGWWSGTLTILTLSLLVPVAEELFFRGRLLDVLRQRLGGTRMATVSAVSLTTLAFAAAHGTQVQALFAIPLGLLLALIRLRGGGIGACIVAHACHNSLFLFVGPVLFARPWAAPLLALAGTMMIAAAWIDHPRTSERPRVADRWRALVAVVAVVTITLVLFSTYPTYRRLQDRLWVGAAHRVTVMWRVDNDVLLRRLDFQEQRGRMNADRRLGLYDQLLREPCQRLPGGNPRQAQVLAQLDPERFAAAVSDLGIYDALLDLADCRARWERLAIAARMLGQRNSHDLASIATTHPECLLQWFPLPERLDDCVQQLVRTEAHDRKRLLAQLERSQPGKVADVLFALPLSHITPLDRRHLLMHYPDAAERLAELAKRDPQRARAFSAPAE